MKQNIIISLLVVMVCCFVACNNNSNVQASQSSSEDYSWVVGKWTCDMSPYGYSTVKFNSDGTYTENSSYGSSRGTYDISDNVIRCHESGMEGVASIVIQIEPGHRLNAGEGHYYHKR